MATECCTGMPDLLARPAATLNRHNFAFLDELSKKAIRRALLKAVAIPGCQVPFGSRELPIARAAGAPAACRSRCR
jgi:alpha-D-ribose 1-methylphosphonate 5-phosphate C-P lyase